MKVRIALSAATLGVALVAVTSTSMATQSAAIAGTPPSPAQQPITHGKPSLPPLTNKPIGATAGNNIKTTKTGTASPASTFWCHANASDPLPLTPKSNTIVAEGAITNCVGNPTACHLGVDLEKYNGYTGIWYTMAHSPGKWKSCKGRLDASYKCTHDPTTQWGYRTHIWLQVEKGSTISPLGDGFSENTKLYWCT